MSIVNIRVYAITVSLLLLFACTDKEPASIATADVSIAVSTSPLSTPVFVAKKKGFFKKHGVNVTLQRRHGGHISLKAVLAGEADYATTSDYPIMINAFKRSDYEVIATFVSSDNDVKMMADKRKNILAAANLKGKNVGVVTGGSSHYFLDRFLLFNAMKLEDVVVKHVGPEKMPDALASGEVDAIAVWEPSGYLAKKKLGANLQIFPAKDYYRETFNIVGLKKTISDNKEVNIRILRALIDASEFIQGSPKEAQQIIIEELSLDKEFIDWIWDDFAFRVSLEQTLLITIENEARWAVENGIVSSDQAPNYLEYINSKPLSSVDRGLVRLVQ